MPTTNIERLEAIFKALGDRTRLRILALLGTDEVCVCHIHDTLGVPQPTASRHLAYLRRAGLVDARRDGVWMHYKVSAAIDPVARAVVDAAVHALTHVPATGRDRQQYQKAFGLLQPLSVGRGAPCCSPRSARS
jgi:ArsR family transcriptional regulator